MARRLGYMGAWLGLLALVAGACCGGMPAGAVEPVHAIAMHGQPLHGPDFKSFDNVNAEASKGGRIVLGVLGSFDSVNPYIIRGLPVAGVNNTVVESLLARSPDEPFTLYGLIAKTIEVPDDRSEITFNIDPKARFSDKTPVTAKDVMFSFEVLRERGRPNHRSYFKKVKTAEILGERQIRFVFEGADRELPLILGLMPVLPSHALTPETFERTSLSPFLGSGPYVMSRIDPGHSVTYMRDPDYWGQHLAVNRGRYNAGELRYDYFRDDTAMFETFKSGALDVRLEDDPAKWFQAYDFPAVTSGSIVKEELDSSLPAPMMGLVFNTRRSVFRNPAVRRALVEVFDFEYLNRQLFNGLFKRTQSFFERSVLSSFARPADDEEKRLLAPFPDAVRPGIMDGTETLPVTDGSGRNRPQLRKALEILTSAGFRIAGDKLIDPVTQAPAAFEILLETSGGMRVMTAFKGELERIGWTVTIRQVDSGQYAKRLATYDFDMIQANWQASLSPGNEQSFRWSGKVANQEGSFNWAGVDNPAVDAMIGAMLAARDEAPFVSAVRALDRVLRSGDYVVPLYHVPRLWIAHARRVHILPRVPLTGPTPETWWVEPE